MTDDLFSFIILYSSCKKKDRQTGRYVEKLLAMSPENDKCKI